MANDKGYVYVLTNDSFRDDWVKIGRTSRSVDERSKDLYNTALPLPFEIYATIQTVKYVALEKLIHKTIDRLNADKRISSNREFFNIQPSQVLDMFLDIAATIEDAVVVQYVDKKPIQIYPTIDGQKPQAIVVKEKQPQRKPFEFAMVGLQDGDKIVFKELNLEVKVNGRNTIEYENRLWSLSAFTAAFLPEHLQNASGAYQGPKYFTYNGKTLWDIRLEMEKSTE